VALVALVLAAGCSSGPDEQPAAPTPTAVRPLAADLPVPRTEVAGAGWRGLIAVGGGLTLDGGASELVHLYDPAADAWRPAPALPVGLHHLGMAALSDRLYVAGGYANLPGADWVAQSRVFSLGEGEPAWREERAMTIPRGAHGLAAVGGRLVAVGGVSAGRLTGRTESWAPGEPSWRSGPDLAEAREHLAVAAARGRVYAIGGRLGGIDTNLRSVESWAPGEGAWRAEPPLNDSRGGTSAAAVVDRPCVAGGEEPPGTIASVECLVAGGRWERLHALQVPRHGLAVAALGNRLHVVAGGPQPGLFVSGTHEVFELG
jgi:hypothetical protein